MHPEIRPEGTGQLPQVRHGARIGVTDSDGHAHNVSLPHASWVVQDHPGNCPKCGMALEPREATGVEENPELADMSRRLWVSTVFALPVFLLAMFADLAPQWLPGWLTMHAVQWLEFLLATPVVLWEAGRSSCAAGGPWCPGT